MKINFVGSFTTGYVGETADETHLANELEYMGHAVNRIPRDIWKAFADGAGHWPGITDKLKADINIVAKWPHFDSADYINILRHHSEAPVFYWVWDYMWDQGIPAFHTEMANAADLYLSNEAGVFNQYYKDTKAYYFPFDVSDYNIDKINGVDKKIKVAFFGSWLGQGDRTYWLPEINKIHPVTVFSWNHEEWTKRGFEAYPAVWGNEFAQKIAESKIILGFNVNDHCWGYWSNRVGKVLTTGGFLLQRYVPGMELFLRDGAEYFSTVDEANRKINYFLEHNSQRQKIADRGYEIGRQRFTSRARIRELSILMERYLKGGFDGFTRSSEQTVE